jgi:anti-sigma B factor antagonist
MLTINSRNRGDVLIIDLEGQIDGSSESQQVLSSVKESLEQKPSRLLLNLEHVRWINSLGVGYLVAAFVSARNQGTSLRLFGVPSRVAAVLQTCGVSPNVIGVFADEEAALKDLT